MRTCSVSKRAIRWSRNVNVRNCVIYEKSNGSGCWISGFIFDGRVQSVAAIGQRRRRAGGAGGGRRERERTAIQGGLEGREVQCLIIAVGNANVHARSATVAIICRLIDYDHRSNRIYRES